MRFYPASDIHNEFSVFNFPELERESETTLVLAGDIFVAEEKNSARKFLNDVSRRFDEVILVAGNHEYYNGSLLRVPAKIEALSHEYNNVHFLHRRSVKLGGVWFVGATLWTDFKNGDPFAKLEAGILKDYKKIRTGLRADSKGQLAYARKVTTNDISFENYKDREFIAKELQRLKGEKVVVVTHHAPHLLSGEAFYRANKMTALDYAYYNTGLDDLILDYGPAFWIHGHTHYKADYTIGDTRVICNPRGYNELDSNGYQNESLVFDTTAILEL